MEETKKKRSQESMSLFAENAGVFVGLSGEIRRKPLAAASLQDHEVGLKDCFTPWPWLQEPEARYDASVCLRPRNYASRRL